MCVLLFIAIIMAGDASPVPTPCPTVTVVFMALVNNLIRMFILNFIMVFTVLFTMMFTLMVFMMFTVMVFMVRFTMVFTGCVLEVAMRLRILTLLLLLLLLSDVSLDRVIARLLSMLLFVGCAVMTVIAWVKVTVIICVTK
jgi:hypothetical protein